MGAIAVEIVGGFDYQTLKPEQAVFVQQQLSEIQGFLRQNVYHAIEIGERLIKVKSCMERGQYLNWLESEFPWGKTSAYEFEAVAERFKAVNFRILEKFDVSALKILATPSTPEDVRTKALALAEAGERVSHARAKALKSGSDLPIIEPGRAVKVADKRSPYYGRSITIQAVDRGDGIARCTTEDGEPVSLLINEIVPEPARPAPGRTDKPPANNSQIEALSVGWEVDKERLEILEDMLKRLCLAARVGKLTDAILDEAEALLS